MKTHEELYDIDTWSGGALLPFSEKFAGSSVHRDYAGRTFLAFEKDAEKSVQEELYGNRPSEY